MIDVKPSCGTLAASLFCGLLLGTTSLQAAIYDVDASEPTKFSDDLNLTVEGTFEHDGNEYTDWNLTTTKYEDTSNEGTFTFTKNNSDAITETGPIIFENPNTPDYVFSNGLKSSTESLFLVSSENSDEDDKFKDWYAISLLFEEELEGSGSVAIYPPNSLGSGFGDGFVKEAGDDFTVSTELPIAGTASTGALTSVPVPGTALLLSVALLGLCAVRRGAA